MSTQFHSTALAWTTAAVMTAALLSACKPEPPIPSVAPTGAPGTGVTPASGTAPDAPVADPRKNMSEADSDLAGRIESALNAETSLHGSRIGVRAADGVVTLTGSTRTPDLRSMASQIALSVTGVRLVRNELAVSVET